MFRLYGGGTRGVEINLCVPGGGSAYKADVFWRVVVLGQPDSASQVPFQPEDRSDRQNPER